MITQNFLKFSGKIGERIQIQHVYPEILINENLNLSFALDRTFHQLKNDILDPYERFILFVWFYSGKMWKFLKKTAVFPGRYGRIGEILHGQIWPDWGL